MVILYIYSTCWCMKLVFYDCQQTACLLIRNTIGSVSCLDGWGMALYFVTYFVICLNQMVQEGTFVQETLALQVGTVSSGNCNKA
jgi:hypothetical protein